MQFNVAFIASALLLIVPGALGAQFMWFKGAGCTGDVVANITSLIPGECRFPSDGSSAKSIRYSGVFNQAQFYNFKEGDMRCAGPYTIKSDGSGCATAVDGFNYGGVRSY